MTARKRADETLQKAHDELEMCLLERTATLAKANEALELKFLTETSGGISGRAVQASCQVAR